MKYFTRGFLATLGLAVGIVAVVTLREATLSTHDSSQTRKGSRIELVVSADRKGAERGQTLDELVEVKLLSCRLEVKSDLLGDIESQGDGRYRAVFSPAMDESDRRQFSGCLEDWNVDHVQVDVISLEPIV